MEDMILDGNAAGILGEVFVSGVTTAVTTWCRRSCRRAAGLSAGTPGAVLRCVTCGAVQVRMVRAPDRAWLDFHGVQSLQVEMLPLA